MFVSTRTVEKRIAEMVDNVSEQQTVDLTTTPVFSVALDESVDINGVRVVSRLFPFARESFRAFFPVHT